MENLFFMAWDFELSFSYNFIKQRELEIKEGSEKNDLDFMVKKVNYFNNNLVATNLTPRIGM